MKNMLLEYGDQNVGLPYELLKGVFVYYSLVATSHVVWVGVLHFGSCKYA